MEKLIYCEKRGFDVLPSTDRQIQKNDRFACPVDCYKREFCSVTKEGGVFIVKSAYPSRNKENLIPCYFSDSEQMWKFGEASAQIETEKDTANETVVDLEAIGDGLETGLGEDPRSIKACDNDTEASPCDTNCDVNSQGLGAPVSAFDDDGEETSSAVSPFGGNNQGIGAPVSAFDDDGEETSSVVSSSGSMSFNGSFKDNLKKAKALRGTDDKGIKVNEVFLNVPSRDFIQIGATIYSNNFKRYKYAKGLKHALSNIFYHWRTRFVFSGPKQLTNEFKWLLLNVTGCLNEEGKNLISEILEDNTLNSIDQKFFYIFYSVVYKNNKEIHFYYKDNDSNSLLTPFFSNRMEFAQALCGKTLRDEAVRRLYKTNQREVLHYLGYLDYEDTIGVADVGEKIIQKENQLFHDLVIELSREMGQVSYIEKEANDIVVSNFGSVKEFCEKMRLSAPLDVMRKMCRFLQKFKIDASYNVGIYMKGEDVEFKEISFDDSCWKKPQNVVFEIMGLQQQSKHLTEYGYYISLLKEYVRVFNPAKLILPGNIILTRDNFFGDIKRIVKDAVMYTFKDGGLARIAVGKGCFVKNLIDNEVIKKYVDANQNNQLDDILALLKDVVDADGAGEMPEKILRKYLEIYKHEATFVFDTQPQTINNYVSSLFENSPDHVINEIQRQSIVKAYIEIEKDKCANAIGKVKEKIKTLENMAKNGWQDKK